MQQLLLRKSAAFTLIASILALSAAGQAKTPTVMLDYYFNHEWLRKPTGDSTRFHYTWEDSANSGFSKLGDVFRNHGFSLASLEKAPTAN